MITTLTPPPKYRACPPRNPGPCCPHAEKWDTTGSVRRRHLGLGQKLASQDPHCWDPELPQEAPTTLTPHPTQTTTQEKPETGRGTDRWTDGAGALAGHPSCQNLLSPAAWHTDGSEMPGLSHVGRQLRS